MQVVKQPLMGKAAIGKQRDHHARRDDGTHLIKHGLVGFKTHLGTLMAQGSPGERNGPSSIDKGGTDQYKGQQSGCIQGHEETLINRPINQSALQYRPIPLHRYNAPMMKPPRKTAFAAGG